MLDFDDLPVCVLGVGVEQGNKSVDRSVGVNANGSGRESVIGDVMTMMRIT